MLADISLTVKGLYSTMDSQRKQLQTRGKITENLNYLVDELCIFGRRKEDFNPKKTIEKLHSWIKQADKYNAAQPVWPINLSDTFECLSQAFKQNKCFQITYNQLDKIYSESH